MSDSAVLLLLHQVTVYSIFLIVQISVDIHLAHIVKEIKIKILHAQLLKLLLEDLFHLVPIGRIVAGKLRRNVETVSRIFGQSFSHDKF